MDQSRRPRRTAARPAAAETSLPHLADPEHPSSATDPLLGPILRPPGSDDPTPLYHRIYMVLREGILDARFPPDKVLPSEIELARSFGVSRVTVRKAFERLEREGLILRQRGRGTFPTARMGRNPVQADVSGLVENLLAMGLSTRVELLEFGYVPAPSEIAAEMDLAPGTRVQRAVRLRHLGDRPFSWALTHVPEDVGRSYTAEDLVETPLLRLFERAGIRVAGAYQRVTARAADPAVAALLHTDVGAPLVCITRVVRDQDDRVIERIRALYHPDLYEFEIKLTLGRGPDGNLWRPTSETL